MVQLLLMAFSVSLDAFSASVTQGSLCKKYFIRSSLITSLFFGTFQGVMPLLGWFLGARFKNEVMEIDHWISFFLLSLIGIRMIIKGLASDKDHRQNNQLNYQNILALAIATSIDALVIGITLAFSETPLLLMAILFGAVTFIMSIIGFLLGGRLRNIIGQKIEAIGGIILIAIGLKILFEHL